NAGLYKGIPIDDSLILSHLFYVDDVVFVGKWDKMNVTTIVNVLKCFFLALGLKINLQKSKLMGIGFPHEDVLSAAESIGCFIFTMPFNFLRVKVGDSMSRRSSWEETIDKLSFRLSKWKLKALSIGGRLTLIKFVLSSLPLYHMSIFKCPMGVLKILKSIRRNLFNGVANSDRNLSLIGWKNILASKKNGELGVLSFFALNRALLFKWGVSSPMTLPYGLSSFRIAPRGGIEEDQFRLLRASVAHILLPRINDRWADAPTRWVKVVPIKINIFGWRVCLDKLPTRLNLSLRGVDVPSILCPLCSIAVESSSHLLFSCQLARSLMLNVARWWELEIHNFNSYGD
ncbi:RNA-directed DNA polymerase, eukaryota, partial [Tanacetum coccineum]